MTFAIDVLSRCVVGMVVTLEAPSALSAGLCLAHVVTDKTAWLERVGADVEWPMSGKPVALYLDYADLRIMPTSDRDPPLLSGSGLARSA